MSIRGLLIIVGGLSFLIVGYLITSGSHDLPQGQLKIELAPSEARVFIDGISANAGEKTIDIGTHKIRITMPGFTSYERTVNITQSVEVYVGIILNSSSTDTKDWFTNHPDDQKITESINDQLSDSQAQEVARKYPIFNRLPGIFGNGSGGLTRIESEAALNNSGKPSIGIYASNPQQRHEALDWINNRDYTISDLDVVFYGARIPIKTEIPQ